MAKQHILSILLQKAKVKKKRPIIFNGYRYAFGWHVNSEEGRFKLDERGSWLSSLLLCVGSGFGEKKEKQILFLERRVQKHEMDRWDEGCKISQQSWEQLCGIEIQSSFPVCALITWLSHYLQVLIIKSSIVLIAWLFFSLLLQQPTCLLFEDTLIACISWLPWNTRRLKCEVFVGVRECYEMTCVLADVVLSVPDIPAPLRYLQLNRSH